jgi:hypothetical protein
LNLSLVDFLFELLLGVYLDERALLLFGFDFALDDFKRDVLGRIVGKDPEVAQRVDEPFNADVVGVA